MTRSRLRLALLGSLLLHGAALLWLVLKPPTPPARKRSPPLEWVTIEPQPEPAPPKPVPPPVPTPPAKPPPPRKRVQTAAPTPTPEPPPEPAATPTREDVPAAPSAPIALVPSSNFPLQGPAPEPPRGHTLHPTDPQFRPENIRAEDEKRVRGRVEAWTEDELAKARAEGGLPDPYFWKVRDAATSGLDKRAREDGFVPSEAEVLETIGKRYNAAAESFAKTGNPNLGPVGDAPTQSEILKEKFGNNPEMMSVRALVQATETQEALSHNKPQLALTLELRQFKDGRPNEVILIARSDDPKFDAFVMTEWPKAMEKAGPPPPASFHKDVLRSIWSVEGWLGLPKKMEDVFSYLPVPGVLGFSADKVLPKLTKEGYHYEFHAKLLRAYP